MKKITLLITMIVAMLCSSQSICAQNNTGDYYDAFIEVEQLNELLLYRLNEAGVTITSRFDGFVAARINADVEPSTIMAIDGVKYVTRATYVETCSDSARYFSNVDPVQLGTGLDMPYTGKGVIIGLIDCGFDFNHINLCDEEGNTRVKAVYMPFDNSGTPPVVRATRLPGSCYEKPEDIKNLTTDDPSTPHGTQTAGIAAGSYRDNGWYGMAPEADIVACGIPESELNDVVVANCISYLCDYASRKGQPCVINMSLGTNIGPHDGTSYMNRICQQLSAPGRVFVVSGGNDGDNNVYVHRMLENSQDTVTVLLRGVWGSTELTGNINAWSKVNKAFNTRLVVVDTQSKEIVYGTRAYGAVSQGSYAEYSTETDTLLAEYCTGRVSLRGTVDYNGKPYSLCNIDMKSNSGRYAVGLQYYAPSSNELSIWTSWYAHFYQHDVTWADRGDVHGSISDFATTDSVISVGNYNSKQYVILRDSTLFFRQNSVPLLLSHNSSYGPDENGVTRPDVCAPGSVIVASANRYDLYPHNLAYWQPSAFVDGVEYPYCPDMGTSMSAAVVSGTVALWMQANPNLSAADVRDILRHSSYKDSIVKNGDPEMWGTGKLDALAGMRYILHMDELIGDVNNDGEVTISDVNLAINIILGGDADDQTRSRADVNKDGEIGISDVNVIINIILS